MLWTILDIGLLTLSVAVLIPTLVLALEVVASLFSRSNIDVVPVKNLRVAVLVPAHNESVGLIPTLSDIRSQLSSQDRLVVVADNCSDDTAIVARHAGAEVIERQDAQKVGKGYALDFGVQYLAAGQPEVLLVIDADCRVAPGTVAELATTAEAMQRPAQALYLMTAPAPASVTRRASEFAWRIKNYIRPSGLHALGLPCQLMGTGMAFPWRLIQKSDLATGEIVEDLTLGLDLAAKGYPPIFCPQVRVTSTFPTSSQAALNQRSRWEHGHVRVLTSLGPKLVLKAIGRGDIKLLALALDLLVPPLALLGFINLAALTITGLMWLVGLSKIALLLSAFSVVLMFASLVACWWSKGRDILPASDLPLALGYLVSKIGLYRKLVSGRGVARWVRTDRGDS